MALLESSSGISGSTPPDSTPININPSPWDVAINTPVSTLADLKNVLIDHLGEQKGTALYNFFVSSIVSTSITQLQSSTSGAQKAAKKMGSSQ